MQRAESTTSDKIIVKPWIGIMKFGIKWKDSEMKVYSSQFFLIKILLQKLYLINIFMDQTWHSIFV